MIYTDGVHLVADSLDELHKYAVKMGIKKHWFHGTRKGHPHYDIPYLAAQKVVEDPDVHYITTREILIKSKQMI